MSRRKRKQKEAITIIIGINGFKGAGKDTVGNYLVEEYDFKKVSFAALLKQSAAALFNIPVDKWEEWKNDDQMVVSIHKRDPEDIWKMAANQQYNSLMTVRSFLQRYGTESHRDVFGYDFWVEQAFKNLDLSDRLVFTDARFENELAAIHANGGRNIQVLRAETDVEAGNHASEVRPDLKFIDEFVYNDHEKEWLYDQIDDLVAW